MKTTEEKNRMIAEFIAGGKATDGYSGKSWSVHLPKEITGRSETVFTFTEDLKFRTSWDWLMPCVIKISELGFEFQIDANETYFKENDGDFEIVASAFNGSVLENTYEAVVRFIEWYNENK